jgi:hypothetical protein
MLQSKIVHIAVCCVRPKGLYSAKVPSCFSTASAASLVCNIVTLWPHQAYALLVAGRRPIAAVALPAFTCRRRCLPAAWRCSCGALVRIHQGVLCSRCSKHANTEAQALPRLLERPHENSSWRCLRGFEAAVLNVWPAVR